MAGVENLPRFRFCLVSAQTAAGRGRWNSVFEDLRAAGYVGRVLGGGGMLDAKAEIFNGDIY